MNKYTKPGKGRNPSTAKPVKASALTKRLFAPITDIPDEIKKPWMAVTIDNGEVIRKEVLIDDAKVIEGHARLDVLRALGYSDDKIIASGAVTLMGDDGKPQALMVSNPRMPGRNTTMKAIRLADFGTPAEYTPPRRVSPTGRQSETEPEGLRRTNILKGRTTGQDPDPQFRVIPLEIDFKKVELRILALMVRDPQWLLDYVLRTDMDKESIKKLRHAVAYDAAPETIARILQEAKRAP